MKHKFIGSLVIFFLTALFVAGTAAAEKQTTLSVTTLYPKGAVAISIAKKYLDLIEQKTNGRVRFKVFYSRSLIPAGKELQSVHAGTVDVAFANIPYFSRKVPLMDTVIPYVPPNQEWAPQIVEELTPILQQAFKNYNVHLMMSHAFVLSYMCASPKPILTPDDYKGRIVRGPGGNLGYFCKLNGGAPVTIPITEVYMAMQKGTMDLLWTSNASFYERKFYEVAPHGTYDKDMFLLELAVIMNGDVWNRLPKDIQKIMQDCRMLAWKAGLKEQIARGTLDIMKKAKAAGAILHVSPPEIVKLWKKNTQLTWEKYIKANGDIGKKIYDIVTKQR